jgi:hypothetical protein
MPAPRGVNSIRKSVKIRMLLKNKYIDTNALFMDSSLQLSACFFYVLDNPSKTCNMFNNTDNILFSKSLYFFLFFFRALISSLRALFMTSIQ